VLLKRLDDHLKHEVVQQAAYYVRSALLSVVVQFGSTSLLAGAPHADGQQADLPP
jgi:hypothetical protein